MGGGLESRCVGRVYGVDGAVRQHHPHRNLAITVEIYKGCSRLQISAAKHVF